MKPEYLDWDSNFFNCRVGRLFINPGEFFSIELLNDFDLVYLVIENEITQAQKIFFNDKALFVDEKLTYQKRTTSLIHPGNHILSWPVHKKATKRLLEIGVASGEFSRFKTDPLIPDQKFSELYKTWVINSVNRTIAEELYYFEEKDETGGMITLGIKNNKADIGILSVHEKFKGRGVGSQLVNVAEYWAKNKKGLDVIQVVTQASNSVACLFYEKCGFTIQKREFIFHWWKKSRKLL
jgi:dTDP-4-amino-4,6-dideoxy-D-galactose acyltransferase